MRVLPLLGLLALCSACDDSSTGGPVDPGPDTQLTLDAAVDAALDASVLPDAEPDAAPVDLGPPGEPTAQVHVVRWLPDQLFGYAEVFASAHFEPALAELGVENGVGWLVYNTFIPFNGALGDGQWRLPNLGEEVETEAPELVESIAALQFAHAGDWVAIGDDLVLNEDAYTLDREGVPVYVSSLEDGPTNADLHPPGSTWPVAFAGGRDVGAWTIPDALTMPADLELTSHDPQDPLPLRAGEPLVLSWAPSPSTDDYIVIGVDGEFTGQLLALPDDGGPVDLTDLVETHAQGNELDTILIERVRRSRHRYPEGTLEVVAVSRQSLYLTPIGAHRVTPRMLSAGKPIGLTVEWPDGAFDPTAGLTLDLGDDIRVSGMVVDPSRHILRAVVEVADRAPPGPRTLTVRQNGEITLQLERRLFVVDDLPSEGLCDDVRADPGIPDGTWLGTLQGLPALVTESACYPFELTGGTQVMPVDLEAGQRLSAELLAQQFAGQLALVEDCGNSETHCARPIRYGAPAVLEYTALTDERVLLAVISPDPRDDATFTLDVSRTPSAPLVLVEPSVLDAEIRAPVVVRSIRGPFAAEPQLTIAGVAVDDVVLSEDARTARGIIRMPAAGHPGVHDIEATLADGQRVAARGVVDTQLFSSPTLCADNPAHTAGYWTGTTFDLFSDIDSLVACDVDPVGPEELIRVDLEPGQTVEITAALTSTDLVLYLLESCEDRRGLACTDVGSVGDPEFLRYTAPNAPTTVYVGLDAFDAGEGDQFFLHLNFID